MFRVEWLESARLSLAETWPGEDLGDLPIIRAALVEANRRLQSDPLHEGESREAGLRCLIVGPLYIVFMVDPDRLLVQVGYINFFRSRN